MSKGVGKNPTLHPCLAHRCLVKITHLDTLSDTLSDTLCKTSTTSFYTDTPKKSKKNLVYKFSQVELQGSGDFNWRVSDCEELLGVTNRR